MCNEEEEEKQYSIQGLYIKLTLYGNMEELEKSGVCWANSQVHAGSNASHAKVKGFGTVEALNEHENR